MALSWILLRERPYIWEKLFIKNELWLGFFKIIYFVLVSQIINSYVTGNGYMSKWLKSIRVIHVKIGFVFHGILRWDKFEIPGVHLDKKLTLPLSWPRKASFWEGKSFDKSVYFCSAKCLELLCFYSAFNLAGMQCQSKL